MILVDANSIAHQAKHSLGNLSWHEKQVGVIFGFFNQILILAKTFEENKFIFIWDSRKSKRRDIFPAYKEARRKEKTPEEEQLDAIAYGQFYTIRTDILPKLGFVNNFMEEGFEADDLIASLVKSYPQSKFIIVSTDEDLYQLLSDNVSIYSTRKKKIYTQTNFWKDYRITPKEWAEVKAIGGCNSDGVPGIKGIGEITACKYLTRKLPINSKAFRTIRENKELIDKNMRLVKLPLEDTPSIKLSFLDNLSFRSFQNVCKEYGFQSFLEKDKLEQWKKFVFKENTDVGKKQGRQF